MFFCQMFSRPKVLWIYTSLFILYSSHIRIEVGEGYKRMNLFVPVHLSIFCQNLTPCKAGCAQFVREEVKENVYSENKTSSAEKA